MGLRAIGNSQATRQFHRYDLLRVIAQHNMNFVLGGIQIIEQPLRVNSAGGSGNGNENFQQAKIMAALAHGGKPRACLKIQYLSQFSNKLLTESGNCLSPGGHSAQLARVQSSCFVFLRCACSRGRLYDPQ